MLSDYTTRPVPVQASTISTIDDTWQDTSLHSTTHPFAPCCNMTDWSTCPNMDWRLPTPASDSDYPRLIAPTTPVLIAPVPIYRSVATRRHTQVTTPRPIRLHQASCTTRLGTNDKTRCDRSAHDHTALATTYYSTSQLHLPDYTIHALIGQDHSPDKTEPRKAASTTTQALLSRDAPATCLAYTSRHNVCDWMRRACTTLATGHGLTDLYTRLDNSRQHQTRWST